MPKKKADDNPRELLTFGELFVDQQFMMKGTDVVFRKTSIRKRSGVRPFACNAKTDNRFGPTVKSGWVTDDTDVYSYADGMYVWAGPIPLTPKGYVPCTLQEIRKLYSKYTNINSIAVYAGVKSAADSDELLYEPDCYLGSVLDEIKSRLGSYYKGTDALGSLDEYSKPDLLMYDWKGVFYGELTDRVDGDLKAFIEECKAVEREGNSGDY